MARLTIILPRVEDRFPEPVRQAIIRRREVDMSGHCACGAAHVVGDDTKTVIILHRGNCAVVKQMNAVVREHGLRPADLVEEAVAIEVPDQPSDE